MTVPPISCPETCSYDNSGVTSVVSTSPLFNPFDLILRWVQGKRYRVGSSYEWAASGPQRVYWIPAGYITGRHKSRYRVGSTRVMAGKDGVLRK